MPMDDNEHSKDSSANEFELRAGSTASGSTMTVVGTTAEERMQITIEDEQLVAKGGWATVSKATLLPKGEVVAVKRVKETRQYKMEILRALPPHENIVQLRYYAAEESEDKNDRLLTLFMDYLPSNLHHVIQEHATGMPLFLIQIYSRQLLGGLQHLAKHNIVHRDLLPRNILIDPDTKSLKLADFGCAKAITSDSPNHPNVGTFQYRALELLFGATIYNCKADIWSAGVIILEMISGKYPFVVTSEDGMLESIFTVLGPITMEQVRDIGIDPMDFPQLLAGSAFNARRWSDIQVFPQTPSVELRSLLNQMLEYSPRRRADASFLLDHDFFKHNIN